MNATVAAIGLVALIFIAVRVGRAGDRRSQERAWRRIAAARRRNWENEQALGAIIRRCQKPDCPIRKFLDPPEGETEQGD